MGQYYESVLLHHCPRPGSALSSSRLAGVEFLPAYSASFRRNSFQAAQRWDRQRVQPGRAIDEFKNKEGVSILVATPGAAKEGLTLTVANHAIYYDRTFSLDDYLQSQDRIHRISQTRDCYIWNLICEDTIDAWVDSLLRAKRLAAQLLQSDLTQEEYERDADYDFGRAVAEILNPAENTE